MEWSEKRKREFILDSQGYIVSTNLIAWVSVRETLDSVLFPARKVFYFLEWCSFLNVLKGNIAFSRASKEGPGHIILGNKLAYTDFFLEVLDSRSRHLLRAKCGKLKEDDVTYVNQRPVEKQILNWGFVSKPNLIRYFVEYQQKKSGQFRFKHCDIEEHNYRAAYHLKKICNDSHKNLADLDTEYKNYKKNLIGAEVLALCSFYEIDIA
ncbi:hypothetical protein CHH49_10915 [Terribacillus saccharophilus]|uniref:hypothetical protein n=1 Tax=Terribacillus saccharophilus TaxID=361277 RepID=UPI000BA71D5E|nr:hypothetical protein [Terribacillus saccharophilus]PAF21403.1 hypothetical protein CHH49_10915 [Terribacillus saccharophilus]